jgi:hypothetical protein
MTAALSFWYSHYQDFFQSQSLCIYKAKPHLSHQCSDQNMDSDIRCNHLDQSEINPMDTSPLQPSRQSTLRHPMPDSVALASLGWSAQPGTAWKPEISNQISCFHCFFTIFWAKHVQQNCFFKFGRPWTLSKKGLLNSYVVFRGAACDADIFIYTKESKTLKRAKN